MQILNFDAALLASGYYFQPHTGSYVKTDLACFDHVYTPDPEDIGNGSHWLYSRYNHEGQLEHTANFHI